MPADLLVVGLGNPGSEYAGTRHNVGAEVVALLAQRHGASLRKGKQLALVGDVRIDGRRVALALSGPVGPTGGFFTAPGVTVSVGRRDPPLANADEYGREWPARVTIGGDKEREIEKHDATWICTR